jgi:hypothetical protein
MWEQQQTFQPGHLSAVLLLPVAASQACQLYRLVVPSSLQHLQQQQQQQQQQQCPLGMCSWSCLHRAVLFRVRVRA